MLKENAIAHSHCTMERLLDEMQDHVLILESPLLTGEEERAIVEYLASCLVLFDEELRGHVEAEEHEMYPLLKQRLMVEYSEEMEALYVEHRMLETTVTRLGFEVCRALRAREVGPFCEQIIALTREVVGLFESHGTNENQIFRLAGLAHDY